MLKQLFFLILVVLLIPWCKAQQNSDFDYQKPLVEVLKQIEQRFGVSFHYQDSLVENKVLKYADWRIGPDFENTMQKVLGPFDLVLHQEGNKNQYIIKPFAYYSLPVEEGKQYLSYLKTLYHNKEEWEIRKDSLKKCILNALGLSKFPKWSNRVFYSNKRQYIGYEIVNVALETFPGVYVCGSLYQPSKLNEKAPVIISPNGHFDEGRYNKEVQIRCAMLAHMGAIVMSYDLFAWGESQLQFESSAHNKSIAQTMQIVNGERVLDFLLSRKHADPERVGITGGSGGGSQTILLSAIDSRISVSVPVVMLSSYFYGGCPCESGKSVHLCGGGTNNVEIAAMMAPKPLLIISDGGDWTAHVPYVELPFLKYIYSFYNNSDNVENVHIEDEGHDYGKSKRFAMYDFMSKHLGLKKLVLDDGTWDESGCVVEDKRQLYVFNNDPKNLPENAIRSLNQLERLIFEEK